MYKIIVWTLITKNDEVLLLKKPDNSEWVLAGGHVEDNESLKITARRRIMEEVGLRINDEDLNLLCIIDRKLDNAYKLHAFFQASKWEGEPENRESDIHSDMKWHKLDSLPDNLGVLALTAIESMKTKELYHFRDHIENHNKH